jgi:hypothetical protein
VKNVVMVDTENVGAIDVDRANERSLRARQHNKLLGEGEWWSGTD